MKEQRDIGKERIGKVEGNGDKMCYWMQYNKIKLRFEKKINRLIKELNIYILMNSCREK